jgi:hypothetical protein
MILLKLTLFLAIGMAVCYPFFLLHEWMNKRFDRINRQRLINSMDKHINHGNEINSNRQDTINQQDSC